MFWMSFLVSFAFFIVGELLRPKPKVDERKPSALGDFNFPTATEGRSIPVVWGTVKVQGPNVTWYGDLSYKKITKKQKTGLFSSKRVTIGYKYYLGMQLALCHGKIDEFIELRFQNKAVTLEDRVDTSDVISFRMNSPELFGKPEEEGGVSGNVRLYTGTFTQPADDYLRVQFDEESIPAYRPICHLVFEDCYLGNRNTVEPVSLILRRTPNPLGLTGGKHNIGGDANPANMIFEMMTNTVWGECISASMIDTDALVAAGNTLYDEGLGLSMQIDSPNNAEELRAEILRHIDGVMFPDPTTGLFTIKLARHDYDVEDLPLFDESVYEPDGLEYSRGSWGETKNTVQIKYIDRSQDYSERVVQQQNLGNISVRNGQIELDEYDYLGISNAEAANNVIAPRVLKTVSSPLASLKLTTNRLGSTLRPGGVFRFSNIEHGVVQQVFRVTDIDYGTLDDPAVAISAVEDIFSVNAVAYAPPTPSEWVSPRSGPQPLVRQELHELPYGVLATEENRVMTLAARNSGQETGYLVYSDRGVDGDPLIETADIAEMTPAGTLTTGLALSVIDGGSFTVTDIQDLDELESGTEADRDRGYLLAYVGGEWLAWQTVTDNGNGTYTISNILRGVFDTTPKEHPVGSTVYFPSFGVGMTQDEPYDDGVTVTAKFLPYTPAETLPIEDASLLTLDTALRVQRPYPPGLFRINGQRYPEELSASVAMSVSWAHRDRLLQSTNVRGQDGGNIGPEAGTTYELTFTDENGDVLRVATDADTSYDYTTEETDFNTSVYDDGETLIRIVNEENAEDEMVVAFGDGEFYTRRVLTRNINNDPASWTYYRSLNNAYAAVDGEITFDAPVIPDNVFGMTDSGRWYAIQIPGPILHPVWAEGPIATGVGFASEPTAITPSWYQTGTLTVEHHLEEIEAIFVEGETLYAFTLRRDLEDVTFKTLTTYNVRSTTDGVNWTLEGEMSSELPLTPGPDGGQDYVDIRLRADDSFPRRGASLAKHGSYYYVVGRRYQYDGAGSYLPNGTSVYRSLDLVSWERCGGELPQPVDTDYVLSVNGSAIVMLSRGSTTSEPPTGHPIGYVNGMFVLEHLPSSSETAYFVSTDDGDTWNVQFHDQLGAKLANSPLLFKDGTWYGNLNGTAWFGRSDTGDLFGDWTFEQLSSFPKNGIFGGVSFDDSMRELNGQFVAWSYRASKQIIIRSSDGLTWTEFDPYAWPMNPSSVAAGQGIRSITYSGGQYIVLFLKYTSTANPFAFDVSPEIYTSSNLVSFTKTTDLATQVGEHFRVTVVVFNGNTGVLFGRGDNSFLMRTTDAGLTWSVVTPPVGLDTGAVFSGPYFDGDVFVIYQSGRFFTSEDGASWTSSMSAYTDGAVEIVGKPGGPKIIKLGGTLSGNVMLKTTDNYETVTPFSLPPPSGNGTDAVIFRCTDGLDFSQVASTEIGTGQYRYVGFHSVVPLGTSFVASGPTGLWIGYNYGANWSRVDPAGIPAMRFLTNLRSNGTSIIADLGGNGQVIADDDAFGSDDGRVYYSTDGVNWTRPTFADITFGQPYNPAPALRRSTTLKVELLSQRDGLDSWQKHEHTVIRKGYGYHYGNYYGG